MASLMEGSMIRSPRIVKDGRYLICFVDNSDSRKKTKVGGQSIFELQLAEKNRLFKALQRGQACDRTWVLIVSFDGALAPGWQRLEDVQSLHANQFGDCSCSPVLDILAGIFDAFEQIIEEATTRKSIVVCGTIVGTDTWDGIQVGGASIPVSISSVEDVRQRVLRFKASGFIANAIAIGEDGGVAAAAGLTRLGFKGESDDEEGFVFSAGLDAALLRRAFADASDTSVKGLGY